MGESSSNPKLKKSYLDAMNGSPLNPDALEFMLDCPDQKILLEYKNFEPQKTMELLIERASTTIPPTPPNQFLEEMNELVVCGAGPGRVRHGGHHSDSKKEARYMTLARKYGIEDDPKSSEPDVITHQRLTFTFPQYFAANDALSGCNNFQGYDHATSQFWSYPALFTLPQFGGLIPSRNFEGLSLDLKKAIITVHIFCLLKHSETKLPLRTHLVLLKKRIGSGVPSDDRRLRFLQNNDVVTLRGKLTKTAKKIFDFVVQKNEFRGKIKWSLLFD